jgi:hypothetical protein
MAARPLIGGLGKGHPNLRSGFNVKFGPPGWSGDLPKGSPSQVTVEPLSGPVYPNAQKNKGRFLGQVTG